MDGGGDDTPKRTGEYVNCGTDGSFSLSQRLEADSVQGEQSHCSAVAPGHGGRQRGWGWGEKWLELS